MYYCLLILLKQSTTLIDEKKEKKSTTTTTTTQRAGVLTNSRYQSDRPVYTVCHVSAAGFMHVQSAFLDKLRCLRN